MLKYINRKELSMSNPAKLGFYLLGGVVALLIVVNLIRAIIGWLWPLAVVAAIGLIVYGVVARKSLGGGGRSLP